MKVLGKSLAICVAASVLFTASIASARLSPRDIYKNKAPAVVLIVASQEGSSSASAGTGSIIRADGTVITNCHVIFDESTKAPFPVVHVFMKPDRLTGEMDRDLSKHYTGKVLAFDRDLDLALLKIESAPAGLPVITLGDPEEVGPGDETVAIGHPEQGGLWTITTGVIGTEFTNFKGIPGKDVFQMETSLNRGNSGGPLFDIRGYQVGVNTAIARQGEGGIAITGVNFAVKASVVKRWAGKQSVALAYGSERIGEDTRVAVAEPPPKPVEPARPVEPPKEAVKEPVKPTPPPDTKGKQTYTTGDGTGTVTVEDDDDDDGEDAATASNDNPSNSTEVKRAVEQKNTKPKYKKPLRFKERYQTPPHPYSYKKLFTAVEKVRARAQEAFDDLEREERKRGR
jgi:serine protease Do